MKSLVWLRSDIRLDDNPAIRNAFIQNNINISDLYYYKCLVIELKLSLVQITLVMN